MKRSTRTVPGTHTRERSLRPRSTSIVCSALSFSDESSAAASPSPGAIVPAIGLSSARLPAHFTTVSGEAPNERKLARARAERDTGTGSRAGARDRARRPTPRSAASRVARRRPGRRRPRGCIPSRARPGEGARSWRDGSRSSGPARRRAAGEEVAQARSRRRASPRKSSADAARVIEAQEHVGDEEPALGEVGTFVRQRHGRLRARHRVVAEVADHRLSERLGLLERDELRPRADEAVPPEPASLDRTRSRNAPEASSRRVRYCAERRQEVGWDLGYRHEKAPRGAGSERTGCAARFSVARRLPPRCAMRQAHRLRTEVMPAG